MGHHHPRMKCGLLPPKDEMWATPLKDEMWATTLNEEIGLLPSRMKYGRPYLKDEMRAAAPQG